MRRCFSRAAIVTTPTQIGADAMKDLGGFTRPVMPVSNGIEIGDYELAEGATIDKAPGELRITFVGRLAQEKNIDVLIEALSLLPEHLNHVILVSIDSPEAIEESLKNATKNIEDRKSVV